MMRLTIIAFCLGTNLWLSAQIDYTKLLIGRNNGQKTLHDGVVTRVFGFAETLSAQIDVPGPTVYVTEGDSVVIDFWNVSQGAPHTIHLHGLDVDQENDGVPSLSYEVHHMEHGYYKFKAPHPGTYIYHCHVVSSIHVQAGMYGVIIVRPSNGSVNLTWDGGETFSRDILLTASEIDTFWHKNSVLEHDTMGMAMVPGDYKPQYFLINGLSGTDLTNPDNYYYAVENDTVFMRLVNIGFYGVRYIFEPIVGARTISSDGRPLPSELIGDTIEILPGERYGTMIELGDNPYYTVTVEHFNLNTGVIESSQELKIKTSGVGLEEFYSNDLVVYPNPSTNGMFFIESAQDLTYSIVDAAGKQIYVGNDKLIHLENADPGIYFLRSGSQIRKLLIL